jgi:hypothetical protein
MEELIFLVEQCEDGCYTARSLSESICTQAENLEELRKKILDAVHCHYDQNPPKIIRLHIVHDEVLTYV